MTDPEDWLPENDFPTPWGTDPDVIAQREREWQEAIQALAEAEKSGDVEKIAEAQGRVDCLAMLDRFDHS